MGGARHGFGLSLLARKLTRHRNGYARSPRWILDGNGEAARSEAKSAFFDVALARKKEGRRKAEGG